MYRAIQQGSTRRQRTDPAAMETASNALLDAVNRGKSHLVKFILEACEGNVRLATNYRDFKGKTPLIRAVYITEEKCRQRIMQMLLAHGANPNYQDDAGRTALSYACELRHNDVVRLLVKHNVDPEMPDKEGNTPLMHCARVGNDTGIGILIKCFRRLGLDIDRCNNDGFTAMLIAARQGYTESASLLAIEGHASVTKTDERYGRNAEQWARSQGCTTPEVALFSPAAEKLVKRRPKSLRVQDNRPAYPSSRTSPMRPSQRPPWNSSGPGTRAPSNSRKSPSPVVVQHQTPPPQPLPQPRKSLTPKDAAAGRNRSRSSTVTTLLGAGSRTNIRGSISSSGDGRDSNTPSRSRPVKAVPLPSTTTTGSVSRRASRESTTKTTSLAVAASTEESGKNSSERKDSSDGSLSDADLDELYNALTSNYTVEEMSKRAGLLTTTNNNSNGHQRNQQSQDDEDGNQDYGAMAASVSLTNLHL